jgi:hypothetical protein
MSFKERWSQVLDYIKAVFTFRILRGDSPYSVRKFLAYGSGLVFFGSCIYTAIETGGSLDTTQYAIIGATFTFYFGKDFLRGIKLGVTNGNDEGKK